MLLRLACRLYPRRCRIPATVQELTGCPFSVRACASWRVLLHVHRKGDMGSPRVEGSTSSSRARTRAGSLSASRLRPPPGRRTRSGATGMGTSSSSLMALRTVGRDTSAAHLPGLRSEQQPALAFVQVRPQRGHPAPRRLFPCRHALMVEPSRLKATLFPRSPLTCDVVRTRGGNDGPGLWAHWGRIIRLDRSPMQATGSGYFCHDERGGLAERCLRT